MRTRRHGLRSLSGAARMTGGASAGPPPVADFSGTPTTITGSESATFTDISTNMELAGEGYSRLWEWSPTGTDTWTAFVGEQGAESLLYADLDLGNVAGGYDIRLTATNPYGSDSETKVNYIAVV